MSIEVKKPFDFLAWLRASDVWVEQTEFDSEDERDLAINHLSKPVFVREDMFQFLKIYAGGKHITCMEFPSFKEGTIFTGCRVPTSQEEADTLFSLFDLGRSKTAGNLEIEVSYPRAWDLFGEGVPIIIRNGDNHWGVFTKNVLTPEFDSVINALNDLTGYKFYVNA